VLRDLHVRNLAVIVEAQIEFGSGLNILTGETGAGKSIVVDSLALLSGARASQELIRTGADTLSVSGVFEPGGQEWRGVLEQAGIEVSGPELTVRREINRAGRNRVFLDDQPVTLGLLARLAPELLRIHTQREELGLVSPELQRIWLDKSSGPRGQEAVRQVEAAYDEYAGLADRLERAQGNEQLRREQIDLLGFQIEELDAARLQPDEDEQLRAEREVLRHREAIAAALGSSYGLLFEDDGAAGERISLAIRRLQDISDWEPLSDGLIGTLESMKVGLEDLAGELRRRLDQIEADPSRLDVVEERLSVIERLTHKYGRNCTGLIAHREALERELEELTGAESLREELSNRVGEALQRYSKAAESLSALRRNWGRELSDRVHHELADLALGKARFAVSLDRRRRDESPVEVNGLPVEFSSTGYDQVSYQLAANPGEDPAPLSSSASGGELSRIYLAVQLAIRASGPASSSTLVFDEVDAGIGGAQAAALGKKLARLAQGGQILVVTHLPQVACYADRHFRVEKRTEQDRTVTRVRSLDDAARVEEVARMLAGKRVTELSLSHAREMITSAAEGLR
jgi:DNA repair protein RecN (Recombination protein N)